MDYSIVFARLNRAKVRYLVAGGVAVGLHGYIRVTHDLDLMIDFENGNVVRALRVLKGLGLRPHIPEEPERFADPEIRKSWIREKHMIAFPWYHPRDLFFRVDVFVVHPVPFAKAYPRRIMVNQGRLRIPTVGLEDLLKMKRMADRDKDQEDIRFLRWKKSRR